MIHPDLLGDFEVTARAIWQGLEIAYGINKPVIAGLKARGYKHREYHLKAAIRDELDWLKSPAFVEQCERIGITPAKAHECANFEAKRKFERGEGGHE